MPGGKRSATGADSGRQVRRPLAMLVDDDIVIADMYRMGLEHAGFRVTVLGDPASLFRAIRDEVPDVLVLDWQLPGMSGAEALELLRRDEGTRRLPVLMLSNFVRDPRRGLRKVPAGG